MSRYYEKTQKASYLELQSNSSRFLDLKDVVSGAHATITEEAHGQDGAPKDSLASSRRIRLPHTRLTPSNEFEDETVAPISGAYRALRTRVMRLLDAKGLLSVAITSALEGEGKTLAALNLAISCARLEDMRVLLVDSDLRKAGLTQLLSQRSPVGRVDILNFGLVDILSRGAKPETAILSTNLPNLYILAAGNLDEPSTELFAGNRWKEFLDWSRGIFKMTIVDAPPFAPLADTELISAACDGVLMIVRCLSTPRDVLHKVAQHLDRRKLLGVVFNSARPGKHNSDYKQRPAALLAET